MIETGVRCKQSWALPRHATTPARQFHHYDSVAALRKTEIRVDQESKPQACLPPKIFLARQQQAKPLKPQHRAH